MRRFTHSMTGVVALLSERARWLARQICPHEPALRRWLASRLPHGVQADDVVQEAYARIAVLPEVEHIANPRAYLFRTAITVIATELRRVRPQSLEGLNDAERARLEAVEPLPDAQAEGRQELELVADAIAQLPPRCREAFVLRKVHGLSQRETAQALGITENTVEKHVGRGIRHLIFIFGRGGKSALDASLVEMADADRYDEPGNQHRDRATGGSLGREG